MEEVNIPEKEENSIEEFALPGIISARFKRAEDARYSDEQRWLKAYRNYRGIYSSDMAFSSKEKSQIFVKITKTKVLAAYGQLVDVIFGTGKFFKEQSLNEKQNIYEDIEDAIKKSPESDDK